MWQAVKGGAADRAGIAGAVRSDAGTRLGDVIVGIDGVEVHRSKDLYKALDNYKVGDTVEVTLDNNGKRRKVKVELQAVQ